MNNVTNNKLFSAVEIEINSNCNLKCSYCPNSITERIEKGEMTKELYELIINQLKSLDFQGRISYDFYNEPTLSSNLIYFIEFTKLKIPKSTIELYSNGTLINNSLFERLENAGVDKFVITKHQNIQNYIFDTTIENLTENQKSKILFRDYKSIVLTNRGGTLEEIKAKSSTALLPCFIPQGIITISCKGNVIPCFEDFYQVNSMGNIQESTLYEIWNSEKYMNFRKNLSIGLRHKYNACNLCSRTEVVMEDK